MKKIERIEALEICTKFDIEVIQSWWNPFQNVQWNVLESKKKLTYDQYKYLSNNNLIEVKSEPVKDQKVIMTISDVGKEKLQSLINTK